MERLSSYEADRLNDALYGMDRDGVGQTQVSARYVRTDPDGTAWVRFEGSDKDTPLTSAMSVMAREGDIIDVSLGGYEAVGGGNRTDPSAGFQDVRAVTVEVEHVKGKQAEFEKVTAKELEADKARIGELEADHVSTQDLEATNARIGAVEADYLKAADMEAETARVDDLLAKKATVNDLNAATGRITVLESTKANIADIEANYITADDIEATYMHANMSNSDVAWISNGVIANGAISSAMINDVSANKLTAGTINGSVINVTNLNADNITAGTINGQRIGTGSLSLDKLSEDVYTESEVDAKLATMQAEIDGAIETWTGTEVPTLSNAPASAWTTASDRDTHVGDVYFVVNSQSQQNGYNYRFTKSGSAYSWQLIKDNDVTNALQRISAAEGKITQFDSDISTLKTDTGTLTTRTTSLETRADGVDSALLDKVDTTDFNELSDTVDGHTQTLSQHTTAISNKADGSTVTALTTRVSKNEQDISGINTTIGELQTIVESKADGSDVTAISSKLNTVSDTVDGHTQTISSVQSTLATKADGSTVTALTTRVSDVEQDVSGFKTTVSETYATKTEARQTDSASGLRELPTEDAAELPMLGLTVHGECAQDGMPTPDAPVEIRAVRGMNLFTTDGIASDGSIGAVEYVHSGSEFALKGTATSTYRIFTYSAPVRMGGDYILTIRVDGTCPRLFFRVRFADGTYRSVGPFVGGNSYFCTVSTASDLVGYTIEGLTTGSAYDCTVRVQLAEDLIPIPYAPYGCIAVCSSGRNIANSEVQVPYDIDAERTLGRGGRVMRTARIVDSYDENAPMTLSFEARITEDGTSRAFSVYPFQASGETISGSTTSIGSLLGSITPTTEWQRYEFQGYVHHIPIGGGGTYTQGEVWMYDKAGTNALQIRRVQLERGTEATDYEPYRESVSYIDLKGEELCSLPDGTEDVLTVDASGHAVVEKRVAHTEAATTDGVSATVGADAWSSTGYLSDGADVYYPAAASRTVDLGYIDMPTTFDGGTVHVNAEIQPVIDASWWTKAGYETGKAYNDGNGSADLAALTERVTTAESSITQQAGQIALKANASDVYTKQESTALLEVKANKATLTSEINASADTVKIDATRVNIEGAAIFTSGRLSQSSLDGAYDASGAASAALSDAKGYVDGKGYQTASDVSTAVANGTANLAPKSTAVKRTQRIYYRKSASGAPTTPSSWVTNGNTEAAWTKYNAWSTRTPPIAESKAEGATKYLYLYTCEQREMADGTLAYTTVLLDDSTTVIDGGNIITGSVAANKIVGHSISADQLTVGVNNSIADAATTATNYITEVTGGGIKVHDANDTSDYVQITSDGMDVYNDGESVARFGSDGAQIGKNDSSRLELGAASLRAYDADGNLYFNMTPDGLTADQIDVNDDLRKALLQVTSLIIGSTDGTYISANGNHMGFMSGGNEVAYIDVDPNTNEAVFYMTRSIVVKDMQFGDGMWKWYKRDNNNMSLKWLGGM